MKATHRWQLAIAALGATALLAACSSGATGGAAGPSASAPDTPAAGPSVSCAQITALRKALDKIGKLTVNAKLASQVSADLRDVRAALARMKGEADSLFLDQAAQITSDLGLIGTEARALSSHSSATVLKVTRTGVTELKRVVSPVATAMRLECSSF